jgi:hypothetical protein
MICICHPGLMKRFLDKKLDNIDRFNIEKYSYNIEKFVQHNFVDLQRLDC